MERTGRQRDTAATIRQKQRNHQEWLFLHSCMMMAAIYSIFIERESGMSFLRSAFEVNLGHANYPSVF